MSQNIVMPYRFAVADVPAWEFIDSDILTGSGTILEVHFGSAINFSDVQSFVVYQSCSLDQTSSHQDAQLRIGTGGSVISTGSYEAYGVINQNNSASYLNSSYGEASWRTETSNLGGTYTGLTYITFNPKTDFAEMVQTISSDNRQTDPSRPMANFCCGGFLNSTLTSLQDIEITSGNNFLAESRMYVYKVLNS